MFMGAFKTKPHSSNRRHQNKEGVEKPKPPLTKDSVAKIIKSAARRAGIENWRDVYPHCIRKASESFFRGRTTTGIPLT